MNPSNLTVEEILYALKEVVSYNCLDLQIAYWLNLKPNKYGAITRPANATDPQVEVIWMIAVLLYGDYGTSPRYGWIEDAEDFNKFIQKLLYIHEEKHVINAKNSITPKSCKSCPYKYKDIFWFCLLEKTGNSDASVDDNGEPFDFVPDWCKLKKEEVDL